MTGGPGVPVLAGRLRGAVALRAVPVALTFLMAVLEVALDRRPLTALLGVLAVAAALLAALQRQEGLFPALPVLLLLFQYLAASSHPGPASSLAFALAAAVMLFLVHESFGLAEQLPSGAAVRAGLLRRSAGRVGVALAVSVPLVLALALLGEAAPSGGWLRELGPPAAAAAVGLVALVHAGRPRELRAAGAEVVSGDRQGQAQAEVPVGESSASS